MFVAPWVRGSRKRRATPLTKLVGAAPQGTRGTCGRSSPRPSAGGPLSASSPAVQPAARGAPGVVLVPRSLTQAALVLPAQPAPALLTSHDTATASTSAGCKWARAREPPMPRFATCTRCPACGRWQAHGRLAAAPMKEGRRMQGPPLAPHAPPRHDAALQRVHDRCSGESAPHLDPNPD